MANIQEAAVAYQVENYPTAQSKIKLSENEAHAKAMRASIPTIVQELEAVLTRPVAAFAVGVKDPKTFARWANQPLPKIRQLNTERRLRAAYQVVTMLQPWDDDHTIRSWFVGMNPVLADISVAEAIRSDRVREALDAAHDFIGQE
ncbi:MAG: hypothetical protein WKF81_04540 [Thermomicrobiales bacterium]